MMKPRTDYEGFRASSEANRQLLCQEELILEVTETLARALRREKITKAQLATRLGKSKAFVTQVLGGRNLTLKTIADVARALHCRIRVEACPEHDIVPMTTCDAMAWTTSLAGPWSRTRVVIGQFGKARVA